jgi:hypothetical protein
MKIIENVRKQITNGTSIAMTQTFVIFGMVEAFEKSRIGLGIFCIFLLVVGCAFWCMCYKNLLKSIDGEVQRFWNNLKIMTEVEDFDLVGEEKKNKHIPRID